MVVKVDLLDLYPCCALVSNLLDSNKNINLFPYTFSSIFPGSGSRLIGLRLFTNFGDPFLGNGVIMAAFHSSGKIWCLMEALYRIFNLIWDCNNLSLLLMNLETQIKMQKVHS